MWYGAVAKAYFYPVFPESWGGYIGKGWGINIFGRLFANYDTKYFKGTIIQLGDQNLIFDSHGNIKNKGQYYKLNGGPGGYTLTAKNGIKYHFYAQYYDRDVLHVMHYLFNNEDEEEAASQGFYLSSIEDAAGNTIRIEYKPFGETFDEDASMSRGFLTVEEWQCHLMYRPLRPVRIIDTYGRAVNIYYRSNDSNEIKSCQIESIDVMDSNGITRTYRYAYGTEGSNKDCLIEVIPPTGNSTKYDYKYVDEKLGDDYEDDGYILSKLTYPTGATISYNYSWFDPLAVIPDLSVDYQKRFSGYRVESRNLAGNSWIYSYSGGTIHNEYIDGSDKGKAFGFDSADVTDPLGGTTNCQYKEGLSVKEINPAGHITDYTWDFDKKNLLNVKVNKSGSITITEYQNYDGYGNPRVIREYGFLSDPFDDRETHLEYMHDRSGTYKKNHIVDRVCHRWITGGGGTKGEVYFDYDGGGKGLVERKREMTDSGIATTYYSYDYNNPGNMISLTDPNGNSTNYSYGQGAPLPTSISTNAGGRTLNLARSYSPHTGALMLETDYNGNATSYSYDPIGRVTRKSNPDGTSISYTYNDMSNTIDIRDEKGEETTYFYDSRGRLIEVRQPENVSTRYTYNPLSKITSVRDAGGKSTGYQYDQIGRLTGITYPDGSSTGLSYRDSQSAVDVTDGNGNITGYRYDGIGNLVEVNEANGNKTRYSYDCLGNIQGIKDPRNLITTHSWTTNGKLASIKESEGSITNFTYDKNGNIKRREDGKGASISYIYDELNRATAKHTSDAKFNVTYNYDEPSSGNGMGMLTSVDTNWGKTIVSYDKMGRVISKARTIDSKTYLISYQYDPAGNLIKTTDPSGKSTSYAVDGLGRVTSVKRETSNGEMAIAEYRCNPSGTIAGIDYGNGAKTSYSYDNRDRVKQLQVLDPDGNVLVKQNMAYDPVGNRLSLSSHDEEDVRYEYDNLNRLTKVSYPKDSEEFHYDNAGNRLSLKHAFGEMEYIYDAASNKLNQMNINSHGKVRYSYDGAGNQIKENWCTGDTLRKSMTYKYDPEDRLIEMTLDETLLNGEGTKESKSEYTYDDSGMRIKKSSPDGTTVYHYDELNQVIAESDDKRQIKSSYIYANAQKIAEVKPDGSINYFHNDALGSPVLVTDKNAKDVQRYIYEPFGNMITSKGNGENHYTFTGKERDSESNLFYFGARYYNPILGRFISKDIVEPNYEDPQSLNRYVYAMNNPIKFIDPTGLYSQLIQTNYVITSSFNEKRTYMYNGRLIHDIHKGTDYACKWGTPEHSILAGTIVFSGSKRGYGNMLLSEYQIGLLKFWQVVAHNSINLVRAGQYISESQITAFVGSTGTSTGSHAHEEFYFTNPEEAPGIYNQMEYMVSKRCIEFLFGNYTSPASSLGLSGLSLMNNQTPSIGYGNSFDFEFHWDSGGTGIGISF